jgi:hypothetical protein
MRKLLSVVGRGVRAFLWIVRGLLLLIALGVLVLWPMSSSNVLWIEGQRWLKAPQMEQQFAVLGFSDGEIFIENNQFKYDGIEGTPRSWRLKTYSAPSRRGDRPRDHVRWEAERGRMSDCIYELRELAAPCWLVAPAFALWPVTSIGLLIRRRRKQCPRDRIGCCQHCGYDLRATPEQCPECGAIPPQNAK